MSNESFSLAMTRRGDGNIGDPPAVAFVTVLVTGFLIWRYRNWTIGTRPPCLSQRVRFKATVCDVMIDKLSGKVAYAIMSFGGFLGVGESYHPLPWNTLKYDTRQGGYVVGLTRQQPTFARTETPAWGDRAYEIKHPRLLRRGTLQGPMTLDLPRPGRLLGISTISTAIESSLGS